MWANLIDWNYIFLLKKKKEKVFLGFENEFSKHVVYSASMFNLLKQKAKDSNIN